VGARPRSSRTNPTSRLRGGTRRHACTGHRHAPDVAGRGGAGRARARRAVALAVDSTARRRRGATATIPAPETAYMRPGAADRTVPQPLRVRELLCAQWVSPSRPEMPHFRYDQGWTELLKRGPDGNSRLFFDWFLIRLNAARLVQYFSTEQLTLCTYCLAALRMRTYRACCHRLQDAYVKARSTRGDFPTRGARASSRQRCAKEYGQGRSAPHDPSLRAPPRRSRPTRAADRGGGGGRTMTRRCRTSRHTSSHSGSCSAAALGMSPWK